MSAKTNDLPEPWRTFQRRKVLIVVVTAVVAAIAFSAAKLQPPRYEAVTDILFETPVTEPLFPPSDLTAGDPVRALQTEIQLVRSEAVTDSVRRTLGVDVAPEVAVEPVGQSNVIRIIAADRVPDNAAAIGNAYADSYIQVRRDVATDARNTAEQALAAEIAEVGRQVDALNQQIDAASAETSASLASERDALVSQGSALSTRLREVRVEAAAATGRARVVVPATAPTSPVSPKPLIATAVGVAFGLLLGMTMAMLVERRSGRRRVAERALGDVERSTDLATLEPEEAPARNGSESANQSLALHSSGPPEDIRGFPTPVNGHVGGHSMLPPDSGTR